jgi:hypothetical protein
VAISPVPSYQTPTLKPRPSLFGALTEFVPASPVLLVTANTDALTRKPIAQAVAQALAPRVYSFVAEEEVVAEVIPYVLQGLPKEVVKTAASRILSVTPDQAAPAEEIPDLVTTEIAGKVRKPGQQKANTLRSESYLIGALEETVAAAPEEIPDLIAAGASSKVREPIDRPVRTLRAESQVLFGLEETPAPPAEGGVVPLLIAEGVDGLHRRSPSYKKTEPRPAEVFYFYQPEFIPDLIVADVNSVLRKPSKQKTLDVFNTHVFNTLEQTPPPPEVFPPPLVQGLLQLQPKVAASKIYSVTPDPEAPPAEIPDVITSSAFGKIRKPNANPQRTLRNESQLFFGLEEAEAPPAEGGIVPPLVAADVDSLTRRSPAYKKIEPRPGEVIYFFQPEFIPDFIASDTSSTLRKPLKQDTVKVGSPKTLLVTPDPQGDVPSLVAAGMSGKFRRAMGNKRPDDKPAGPAIFFTLLPQTPPPPDVRYPTGGMLAAQHTRRTMRRGR